MPHLTLVDPRGNGNCRNTHTQASEVESGISGVDAIGIGNVTLWWRYVVMETTMLIIEDLALSPQESVTAYHQKSFIPLR